MQKGEMMKKKNHYVFLLIETDNLEKWVKIKNQLEKDEELIEFRYTKMLPKYDEFEAVEDTGAYAADVEATEAKSTTKFKDKQYR
jgi:hypothetical protein